MKMFNTILISFFFTTATYAQHVQSKIGNDTLQGKTLENIILNVQSRASNASYLPDIKGMNIFAGKRTSTLTLPGNTAGMEVNLGRTALARIPGLTMWEMDGAGTQLNIGTRGTDPHRSIEMNMRQNGYNTNSDIFGYPENHYTVPMQAIEEIDYVRGSAALQFGPQFGGMMNYKIKEGDSTKPFAFESEQTIGSNNLFNAYNAIGGTKGKLNYYAFYNNRHGDGWRDNSKFNYQAFYVHIGYQLNKKMNIALEFSRMDYVQQIAGGQTDAQFKADPAQSARARNYFQPIINIPALSYKYNISNNTHLQLTIHSVIGQRNSVQFINAGNIADTINTSIGAYNPRQIDRDYYKGITAEARLLHLYRIGKINSVLAGGVRYFTEQTKRKQKGTGTSNSDFDLSLTKPYGVDLRLNTVNYAAFIENIFQITPEFSVTPGLRYEIIKTDLTGVIDNANTAIGYKSTRSFPLFGTGLQYQLKPLSQLYANVSQAYRPYLYASVTPAGRLDKIDPSLKDSKGYSIDFGYRGRYKNILQYDVNLFYLYYGNKIGLLTQLDGATTYLFTTNIGNSVTKGVEAFGEISLTNLLNPGSGQTRLDVRIFNSVAYNHARYVSGVINQSGINKSVDGYRVENAPDWVNKTGLKFKYKTVSFDFQYSYTSKSYNDAFNTESSSNGVVGAIPAYKVWDWNAKWQYSKTFYLSVAINNFTNQKYFNRRITYYPGPGILPADGRTINLSIGVKI